MEVENIKKKFKDTRELTKFLRSKDADIHSIIEVCRCLLRDELDIFFPNKKEVVFDFFLDRVNDEKTPDFKNWKIQKEVYIFLIDFYVDDKKIDPKCHYKFENFNVFRILTCLFEQKQDVENWILIYKFLQQIKLETIKPNDFELIDLLNNFLNFVNNEIFDEKITTDYVFFIELLFNLLIFDLSNNQLRKIYIKFVENCFINIIHFLKNNTESKMNNALKEIIIKFLFNEKMIHLFSNAIIKFFESTNQFLDDQFFFFLFKFVLEHTGKYNLEIIKSLLLYFNSTKTDSLIRDVLDLMTIKFKFAFNDIYFSIYKKRLEETQKDLIDIDIANFLFILDIELCVQKSKNLICFLKQDFIDNKKLSKLSNTILLSFVKSNQFEIFINDIWILGIKTNKYWSSKDFVDIVSHHFNNLSDFQLNKLIKTISSLDYNIKFPIILSILKSLFFFSTKKIDSVKDYLIKYHNCFDSNHSNYWIIKYYILCHYGDFYLQDNDEFLTNLKNNNIFFEYFFYCVLRYSEIKQNSILLDIHQDSYTQILIKSADWILFFLNRWIVIVNTYFNEKNLKLISKSIFISIKLEELNECFRNSYVLYEQKNLMFHIVNFMIKLVKKKIIYLKILHLIPIQCMTKIQKCEILSILYGYAVNSQEKSDNYESRIFIKKFLGNSFSNYFIENDLKSIVKIIETSFDESESISNDIVLTVFRNNLNLHKENENKNYLMSLTDFLNNHLTNFHSKNKIDAYLKLTLLFIISVKDFSLYEELDCISKNLLIKFTDVIFLIIEFMIEKNIFDYDKLIWSLSALNQIDCSNKKDKILTIIKNINQCLKLENSQTFNEIRFYLFVLMSKQVRPSLKNSMHILSLFYLLTYQFKLDLNKYMCDYLKTIDNSSDLVNTYLFIIHSSHDMDKKNSVVFSNLLVFSFDLLTKKNKCSCFLFVKLLSTIIDLFENFSKDSLLGIISSLSSLLYKKMWLITQYILEKIMVLVFKISILLNNTEMNKINSEIFISTTHLLSQILLFHRNKLSSRYHLIISIFTLLLEVLTKKKNKCDEYLLDPAKSYSRLLSNYCESQSMKKISKISNNELDSVSDLYKIQLKKVAPILLSNFINLYLRINFSSLVYEDLLSGIFAVFDVLTKSELNLVNSIIDSSGKSYFKILINKYQTIGKWKIT